VIAIHGILLPTKQRFIALNASARLCPASSGLVVTPQPRPPAGGYRAAVIASFKLAQVSLGLGRNTELSHGLAALT
jgi:hypothetical protein